MLAAFLLMGAGGIVSAVADSFQSPLDTGYHITGYRFGVLEQDGSYHTGEDLRARFPQPVRAVADGKVVWRKEDSDGYGNVVVIQHTLPDGRQFCSIYGHLSRQAGYKMIARGTDVSKGQVIGHIGQYFENGHYPEHLHLGFRKGAFDGTYAGKTWSKSVVSNFYKPSDFINLIRATNDYKVFRLSDTGAKIQVPSPEVFTACGWNWDDVRPVSAWEASSFYTSWGSVYFPSGTFIKRVDRPEIYKVQRYNEASGVKNHYRQWCSSWNAFIRAGGRADLSNVRIVSPEEFGLYSRGPDIS